MRNEPNLRLERYRQGGPPGINAGWFVIPRVSGDLRFMVGNGGGWDHVSISLAHRCPTWDEMCLVKDLVFRDDEWVMQLHPARKDHINNHPFCLHLWRPQSAAEMAEIHRQWDAAGEDGMWPEAAPGVIPLPPNWMVGFPDGTAAVVPRSASPP
jgi:hypothetical protein